MGLNPKEDFIVEYHFYNPESDKHGWADFAFPSKNLIIELDGTQHRHTKEKDQIRDEYLTRNGWTVIRIPHKEYIKQVWNEKIQSLLLD